MGMMSRFLKRFRILFARGRFLNELDEEVAFHRQQAEEEYLADGMTLETGARKRDTHQRAELRSYRVSD